jgi:hypothetical protein
MMKNGIKSAAMAAVLATSGMVSNAFGLASLPFIEDFASGNANWATSNSSVFANWNETGGVDGGGYISANATVPSTPSGFGFIAFRGNDANNASGDAFVGNWLEGGVTLFTTYVRHNATGDLSVYARLDSGSGRAGSSAPFTVAPNTWTQLSVPIVDSPSSFQSYGAGNFTTVFSNIQNVQIALSATQDYATVGGQSIALDVDRISIVPEPGAIGLAAGGGLLLLGLRAWRNRKK